jgi:hypothetical protein
LTEVEGEIIPRLSSVAMLKAEGVVKSCGDKHVWYEVPLKRASTMMHMNFEDSRMSLGILLPLEIIDVINYT